MEKIILFALTVCLLFACKKDGAKNVVSMETIYGNVGNNCTVNRPSIWYLLFTIYL